MTTIHSNDPHFSTVFDELLNRGKMDMEHVGSIVKNIIDENGFATPVTMVDESKEVQKKINDKLFNISFSLESSASILGQRA